jgi:uncharacterized protein YyaL (SSP411 family)
MAHAARSGSNRLAQETSPYLLQHAGNPVDWFPWGAEALELAQREQKPIFLSIGYSACHWCHVMERECFENPAIAELMNTLYVNIKVDREERPDLDEIYMKAVTALTGSGGWPMSVFLTPDLKPFFGATYLPPERRRGRPSFPDVLVRLAEAWQSERAAVADQAERLTALISEEARADLRGELDAGVQERAREQLLSSFDREWGGFGAAPKFPHSGDIRLLLREQLRTGDEQARHAAVFTLQRMARGGIYDQLGGGFHRYSTDDKWLIPHFEKMLYDNALLIPAYLEAFLVTSDEEFARVARESCEWVLREMRTAEGGFASAQDADSEGEEGRFFVWTRDELEQVLGPQLGSWAAAFFDVTQEGNFESGKSALWRPRAAAEVARELGASDADLARAIGDARVKLLAAREARVRPLTDDKVLASWNGLMLSALAHAHQVLREPRYLRAAQEAARYVLTGMRRPDGGLFATARLGRAHVDGCLDDHVFMIQGLIDLYQSDFDSGWLREALALCEIVETRFADPERGGYFTTGERQDGLIARTKTIHDGALPSGTGVQALNLARLASLTGRAELESRARAAIAAQAALVNRHPRLFAHLLIALDFLAQQPREIVVSGEADDAGTAALLGAVRGVFVPQRVVALASADSDTALLPLLSGRKSRDGRARAYVCRNHTCDAPVEDPASLVRALREAPLSMEPARQS